MSKLSSFLILSLALAVSRCNKHIGLFGVARADDLEVEVHEEGFTDIQRNEDGTVTEPAESDKASATEELIDIGEEESNGYQPLVNDPKLYEALEEADVWGDKSENGENKNL